MTLKEADNLFATPVRMKALKKALTGKKRRLALTGLTGSAPALLTAGYVNSKAPSVIIADDADAAGYFYHDLCQTVGERHVAIFPSGYKRSIKYGQPDPPARILRTETLNAWRNDPELHWVVTYPEALAEKVPAPEDLEDSTFILKRGARMLMGDVVMRLRELGFHEVDYVYEPGQFSRRGSILDVFSYSNEMPYRADFFDDEIDSLRTFNVETQLSEEKIEQASVIPPGTEKMKSTRYSLLDFATTDSPIFCTSFSWLRQRLTAIAADHLSDSALLAGEGETDAMDNVVDPARFDERLGEFNLAQFSPGAAKADFPADTTINFDTSPQALFHKNFDLIADSFVRLEKEGYEIMVCSDASYQTDRLKAIFEDRGDDVRFTPVQNTVHEGFADNELKKCFFTDHSIFDRFHKYNLKSDRARGGKLALSLKELSQIEIGDYIVHIDHGIGRFAGLIKTSTNGHPQELIKLTYQNDDIILVSLHSLHKLSKYRGKEGVPPKISRLGGGSWQRVKERTKTKMKDIARDLIRLYAARRQEKGFAFSPDSYLQHELEASFVYEDTPDQLTATQAIKADMESPRPMDRLVCGDVGFGKTELAIRAAFKAATDGKQVAVLVPTTVLAMQHFRTFSERLKDFPVRVEVLSRARKPKEVKQILADLAEGKIDILIGTHKLIGKSVKFKDLGLLVVDEEQKFGVSVKEKLRQLKANVDTLTLSATPIPRTLQFSLMGARDLSSLTTPPANRQPIETTVGGYDDDLISEAVNFELSRNGQIFFISNRIESLDMIEATLRRLVPNVRVVKAHGQMPPEQLEKAILDFAAHEYDVLLSTTIVESGVDMPNVNTILVHNAQNFGLSELHQLRGRVGRSSRKAFCYLLVPPGGAMTPVARRRLQAIESFSDLGSGIHIAMQDLDIRGAGNLLGAEQSGFIADLGYETYQKILAESMTELKTEEFADSFDEVSRGSDEYVADCVVESDLELRLPGEYVPQEGERISLYQQLDNMSRPEQIETFRIHLRDRFGEIPQCAEELIKVVPLRMAARRLGIERLILKNGQMYTYLVDAANQAYYDSLSFRKMLAYIQRNVMRVRPRQVKGSNSFLFSDVKSVSEALSILESILAIDPESL